MSPSRPMQRCTRCKRLHPGKGMCPTCMHAADLARGTASQRGYGREHRQRFRAIVLRRDPICVICGVAPSTVADHYPLTRRRLVAAGLDPNDPNHGRGLCVPCHNRHTNTDQGGGGGWPRAEGGG